MYRKSRNTPPPPRDGFTAARSRLFVFGFSLGATGERAFSLRRSSTRRRCRSFASVTGWIVRSRRRRSLDEDDARDHDEREERRKVCERLTFPLLLWSLVLVKRP